MKPVETETETMMKCSVDVEKTPDKYLRGNPMKSTGIGTENLIKCRLRSEWDSNAGQLMH